MNYSKIIFTFLTTVTLSFLSASQSLAQAPFYGCAWQDSPVTACIIYNAKDACGTVSGYHSGSGCGQYTAFGKTACENASLVCDKDAVGTRYKCTTPGSGQCRPCSAGETCTFTDSQVCAADPACKIQQVPIPGGEGSTQTQASQFLGKCTPQIPGAKQDEGIITAIGCVPIGSGSIVVTFLLRWGLGIAGGIALILIIYAGFLIMTSQGDPKRLQAGRELMTSAVSGVVLIIFSIFVLRILSINILGFF